MVNKLWSIFSKKKSERINEESNVRGPHMPSIEVPIENTFAQKFTERGGKFIYCLNIDEVKQTFNSIISELKSDITELFCLEKNLSEKFESELVITKTNMNAKLMLCSCEALVSHDGSIVVCNKQFGKNKISDLPETLVVFAGTKQFSKTISDALKVIKKKYPEKIPSSITSIKQFKKEEYGEEDYMSYKNKSLKYVYLILIEDF